MALSHAEAARQFGVLIDVRSRHHDRLAGEGIGLRIVDAHVPANHLSNTKPFVDETLLFASRGKIREISIGRVVGPNSFDASCRRIPDMLSFAGILYPEGDTIYMGRRDPASGPEPTQTGWDFSTFAIGFRPNAKSDELIPLNGIEEADLGVLVVMVDELELLRSSGILTCLSEEGLINTTVGAVGKNPLP